MPFQKPGFQAIYGALESDLRRRAPALTDWEEGSVVRSLFESFAVEMATLYEQMDLVYQAGYVDTATGPSLDRVVAVLGITRNEPDFATGTATFERDPGASAEVVVPAGTLLTTREAPDETPSRKAYVTTEEVRLAPGQATADARIQAEERGSAMTTGAETVVVMPRPVPGVKSVRNRKPVRFLGRDREGDDELRDRARKALLASGRASATAIENALLGLPGVRGVRLAEEFPTVRVQGPGGEPLEEGGEPAAAGEGLGRGVVKVYVDGLTAANAERLRARVDEVRAAGVFVVMEPAVPISVQALLRIEADPSLRGEALALLEQRAEEAVGRWLDRQRMGEPLLFSRLTGEVLAVEGVADLPDFRVVTFREGRAAAEGEVVLSRTAELAAAPLPVPAATELRTATGLRFQTAADALLEAGETAATVPVRALRMGREGELKRTGSAVEWRTAEVGGTTLAVQNPAPIRLPRRVHEPADRRVEAGVEERFVAERVRVAAGAKTLQVHVLAAVALPGPAGAAAAAAALRAAVEAAGRGARVGDAWAGTLDTRARSAVDRALDEYFAAARERAGALHDGLRGTLDDETRAAIEEAVRGYAAEAAGREPPRIEEGEVRDRVEAVLEERLTPTALRQSLDGALAAALAALPPPPDRFPADRIADAVRAGLRRAADAADDAAEAAVAAAAEAVSAAAATLRSAADALREAPADTARKQAVAEAEAAAAARQKEHEAALAALAQARTAAARVLEEETARVPERVESLRAAALAALEALSAPAAREPVLDAAAAEPFELGVRLRTVASDGEVQPDQPYVEPGFLERAALASVFVHTRTLPLAGALPLTLPLTASAAEREQVRAAVRQALAAYLDELGPEEPVLLERLRDAAAGLPGVVEAGAFVAGPPLSERVEKGKALRVEPQERVVLDPAALSLEG
jgi:uncharacterized phage protein gp47/JayE